MSTTASTSATTSAESTGDDAIDLLSQAMIDDPYPLVAELRMTDPIHWSTRHKSWILTRHADIQEAFKHPAMSVELGDNLLGSTPESHPLHRYIKKWMVFADPPAHTRLRALVARAFTPTVINRLDESVQGVVDDLIAAMRAKGSGNFMEDFANPLPAIVISDLFGLPRSDARRIGEWSNAMSMLIHRELGRERFQSSADAMSEFADYLRFHFDRVRETPGDDLLSRLVGAREEGDLLSEDELIGSVMLFLFGGHETTTALLGNALLALTRETDGLNSIAALESTELAVEELLRFDGPGRILVRYVTEDLEFHGTEFKRGQRVFLSLAAGNRDPDFFDDADSLQLNRQPNRHLGFGHGIHYCLGANLARLETRLSLQSLAQQAAHLECDIANMAWRKVMLQRVLADLPYTM